ncbi:F-box protein At5g51370-like [Silene latifolia]|uniref:F-box protein At5g51370-like n=1 Tax=Silene latifolia TaxID=37657 RepID=UPI003D76D2CC
MEPTTTILDVPPDCWKLILSKLHHNHHYYTHILSLTCKQLLTLTNTLPFTLTLSPPLLPHLPALLRRFSTSLHSLSATATTVSSALSLIVSSAATTHLRCIHLTDIDSLPIDAIRHLGSNPNAVKLLTLCNIKGLSDDLLVDICVAFPLVEEIDVSFNDLSDKGILGIAKNLKFLKRVKLSGNVLLTDKSLMALSDCCLDLEEVEVLGCSVVTQYGIGYVMHRSSKLRRVSMNTLIHSRVEMSNSLFSIETSVGFCKNLSNIEFYTMNVDDALLCSIAKANLPLTSFTASYCYKVSLSGLSTFLCAYRRLEKLGLEGHVILTDEAIKGLVCYLGNLVEIDLSYCYELTSSTFQMLVKNCPALEEIKMECTLLGDGELCEPLVKGDNIRCLKLDSNNRLTDDMLGKIGLMCPNLVYLDASDCRNLTSEGIRKLVNCCRKLEYLVVAGWKKSVLFGTGFEDTSYDLEMLQLEDGKFGDECISAIAKACPKLLYVNLAGCTALTSTSVKVLVENCENLRELNMSRCSNLSSESLAGIVSTRPSLRTITSPIKYTSTSTGTKLGFFHQ